MAQPYPQALRERVVHAWLLGGVTQKQVAERFEVDLQTVVRWVRLLRQTGSLEPGRSGGARRPYVVDEPGLALLRDVIECVPDITLPELCALYETERCVTVSPQTMSDTVRRMGLTKKRQYSAVRRGAGPK